ncbi:MAG: hypothetical protein V3S65_07980 [Candidatus Aminicenantaceae bacterium]
MKKLIILTVVIILTLTLFAQELQYEAIAINIEVPVRVFKGRTFIDNLKIDDFEIYEDGKLQKIEAVYLIKKVSIQREEAAIEEEEAREKFSPRVSRNFVFMFELTDYLPKIDEAMDYFFEDVISPDDTLIVATPIKTYKFNKKAMAVAPRQVIADRLKEIIRRDILLGSNKYKSLIRDYKSIYRSEFEQDQKLLLLMDKIRELKNLRYLPENKVKGLADSLKTMEGQKFALFFYQREMLPFPDLPFESYQYLEFQSELTSSVAFDTEKIKQAFSDSSISLHFLYVTKTQQMSQLGIEDLRPTDMAMHDMSMGIFKIFKDIAEATGGLSDSAANVASLLKRAADASENYYLLYYVPEDYKADGKFRKIEVKIKNKKYRITHRSGYIAD